MYNNIIVNKINVIIKVKKFYNINILLYEKNSLFRCKRFWMYWNIDVLNIYYLFKCIYFRIVFLIENSFFLLYIELYECV